MKKYKFVDPETFEASLNLYDDFHIDLIEAIKDFVENSCTTVYEDDVVKSDCVTKKFLADKTGKSLSFGLMRGRKKGEEKAEKYRISIEKIKV